MLTRFLERAGYSIRRVDRVGYYPDSYDQDGLFTTHNHDFMVDAAFSDAYERGKLAAGSDYHMHWRVHIALWAAFSAAKIDGDFVECGVNRGFISSAIMKYLDWSSMDRTFFLLDTFGGIDPRYVSDADLKSGALEHSKTSLDSGFYTSRADEVRKNFAEWPNVRIIQGPVPETLGQIDAKRIAYLHLDMNCSPPEVAAFNGLWNRLSPGAFVLLDDYAYRGFEAQKTPMDQAAKAKGLLIASLPTGQGLIVKPPEKARL